MMRPPIAMPVTDGRSPMRVWAGLCAPMRTCASSMALLVAAAMLAGCDGSSEDSRTIASLSSQQEAIELTSALEQSGVPGVELRRTQAGAGGATFVVSCPDVAAPFARMALTELGLPREHEQRRTEPGASLFPTRADDVAKELERRGNDLESAISLLDGVATSRVQITVDAGREPMGRAQVSPSILIVVRTIGTIEASAEQALRHQITQATAAALPGSDTQNRLKLLISGRAGPLHSPSAKAAIAAAKETTPELRAAQIELSFMTRYIIPLAAIAAMAILVALALKDRWRALISR